MSKKAPKDKSSDKVQAPIHDAAAAASTQKVPTEMSRPTHMAWTPPFKKVPITVGADYRDAAADAGNSGGFYSQLALKEDAPTKGGVRSLETWVPLKAKKEQKAGHRDVFPEAAASASAPKGRPSHETWNPTQARDWRNPSSNIIAAKNLVNALVAIEQDKLYSNLGSAFFKKLVLKEFLGNDIKKWDQNIVVDDNVADQISKKIFKKLEESKNVAGVTMENLKSYFTPGSLLEAAAKTRQADRSR